MMLVLSIKGIFKPPHLVIRYHHGKLTYQYSNYVFKQWPPRIYPSFMKSLGKNQCSTVKVIALSMCHCSNEIHCVSVLLTSQSLLPELCKDIEMDYHPILSSMEDCNL